MKIITLATALLAALLVALPTAAAHPHGTVVNANGTRCYIVTDGFGTIDGDVEPTFWVESNGNTDGGDARGAVSEDAGLPAAGLPYWDLAGEFVFGAVGMEPGDADERLEDGETGLQRTPGPWGAADRQVDAATWAQTCLL